MILDNRAVLKDIQYEDLLLVLNWRNQNHIRNVMYNSDYISIKQHLAWYERLLKNEKAISKLFYFDSVPYGIVNINELNPINRSCEWGFYIGELNASRGMGTVLGYTALNYIFDELKLRKVNASVLENNPRSKHFHEKLGFSHDVTLREHIFKEGQFMDVNVYSILHEEWKNHLKQVEERMEWYI